MPLLWVNMRDFSVIDVVNYVPLMATVLTSILSLVLARATLRYAAASDKSLELAREEFEREWSPELHIKLERVSPTEANIIITNLGRISVLLELVQLRKISHGVPFERYFLNDPLIGGTSWNRSIGERLLALTGRDFDGSISLSGTFYAGGRMYRSDWFRFDVQVEDGKIMIIHPIIVAGRRARVLETRAAVQARRELVKDVAEELVGK